MTNLIVKTGHFLLKNDFLYDLYQSIVGGIAYRSRIVENLVKYEKPMFLDLGCGTASVCRMISKNIKYFGVDNSKIYLNSAKIKFPIHTFVQADLGEAEWNKDILINDAIVATGLGLLHHLDNNQVINFLTGCRSVLNKNSLLFTVDPVIIAGTGKVAKWFAENDRGQYVRNPKELIALFEKSGFEPSYKIKKNQFRVPLDTIEITALIK
jgi:SAM-dependent methyltransferase